MKINAHKQHDIEAQRVFDEDKYITNAWVNEQLIKCNMKCDACKRHLHSLPKTSRDSKQWSITRIDNKLPHHKDNCVIVCFGCNMQQFTKNYHEFKKQFN
jgi:hypothetical protein